MRARPVFLGAGAVLSLLTLVGPAGASPEFGVAIPNGGTTSATCVYCHTIPPALNVFGDATALYTPADLAGLWPALCEDDTDLDLESNGSELGDPCCVWVLNGAPPQEGIVSNPGDPADTAATVCDPNAVGATTGSTSGAGAGTGASTGGTGAGAAGSIGAGPANQRPPVASGTCALGAPLDSPWSWIALGAGAAALAIARRSRSARRSNRR